MDRKIVGLKCTHGDALQNLRLKDAHRIQGLEELNLTYMPHGLTGLLLQDLTKLTYQKYCTDSDSSSNSQMFLNRERSPRRDSAPGSPLVHILNYVSSKFRNVADYRTDSSTIRLRSVGGGIISLRIYCA